MRPNTEWRRMLSSLPSPTSTFIYKVGKIRHVVMATCTKLYTLNPEIFVQCQNIFVVTQGYETSLRVGTCGLRSIVWPLVMSRSICDCFSIKGGLLHNPKGSWSSQLPSRAIALANKVVARALQVNGNSVKCQRGKIQPVTLSRFVETRLGN